MARAKEIEPGTREITTTERVVVPASEENWWMIFPQWKKATERPDFWEFIESLTETNWQRCIMRVWRFDGNAKNQLGACLGNFTGPMNSDIFLRTFGGGKFRIHFKVNSTIVYNETAENEAPHKSFEAITSGTSPAAQPAAQQNNGGNGADVVRTVLAGQPEMVAASVGIMQNAANTAMEMVRAQMPQPAATPDPFDQILKAKQILQPDANRAPSRTDILMEKFLERMVDKMLAEPAAAPAATATQAKSLPEMVKEAREIATLLGFAPVGKGGDATGLLTTLGPQILETVRGVVHDWSTGMQAIAQARGGGAAVHAAAAANPAGPPRLVTLSPPPASAAPSAPAAAPVDETAIRQQTVAQMIHAALVEIVAPLQPGDETPQGEEEISALEDAAAEALAFLNRIHPQVVSECVQHGAETAVVYLRMQPALAPIHQHPLLTAFVAKLIELAKRDREAAAAGAQA